MERHINQLDTCLQEMVITVTKSEALPYYEKAYRDLQPELHLKGFRKGKAPIHLIKQYFGKEVEEDASSDMFNDIFFKVIKEERIQVVGEPEIVSKRINGNEITGTIRYEYIPSFELPEYKGLTIDEPVYVVTDDDINENIERILKHNGEFVEADIVDNEDFIVGIRLNEIDDETNVPIIGSEGKEFHIYLADETVLPTLRENIIGLRVGESFRFKPAEDDKFAELKTYLVMIMDIQRLIPAELNDSFVEKYTSSKFKTVEEFRTDIRYSLQRKWDERSREAMENQIIKQLVNLTHIDLPESLIYKVMGSMVEDLKKTYKDNEEAQNLTVEEMSADLRPSAERMIKWEIIRNKIIELEELKVEENDFIGIAEAEARRLHSDVDTIKRELLKNSKFTSVILGKKVLDLLLGFAITNRIDFDQIEDRESSDYGNSDGVEYMDEILDRDDNSDLEHSHEHNSHHHHPEHTSGDDRHRHSH